MRDNIHPDYHKITVTLPSGDVYETRSTYGEVGANISLDIDPSTHPAWTGSTQTITRGGRVTKFNNRFANLGI
jgi:large subunit ribosomal protein L31